MTPRPLPPLASWLVDRLAPPEWRDSIAGDLIEERDRRRANGRQAGTLWCASTAVRITMSLARDRRRMPIVPARQSTRLRGVGSDIRQAVRALVSHRSYTATVIATLALGIGANASVFNLANWLLLRPLPGVVNERELVTMNFGSVEGATGPLSNVTVNRLAAEAPALQQIAGYQEVSTHVAAARGGAPRRIESEIVSGNYFDVLGNLFEIGRGFSADEGRDPGRPPVVVVSDRFWRQELGGTPEALSRPLTINGVAWTVIGVTVPAFHGPTRVGDTDVWVPIAQHRHILPVYDDDLLTNSKARVFFNMVGRLAPGASIDALTSQMEAVRQRLSAESPKDFQLSHWHFVVQRGLEMRPSITERLTRSMTFLLGAVGLLLLLTAANVGNLMLVRATARRAELATRLALGASRALIVRLLLIESGLLSVAAGVCALGLAALVGRTLEGVVVLPSLPPMDQPLIDYRVFGFAFAAALLVACVAGVIPAFSGARVDLQTMLRDDGRAYTGRGRLRQIFAAAQIVISVTLLIGALLLLRSMGARRAIDPGFDASRVLTFSVEPQLQNYDEDWRKTFFPRLLDRVRQVPGVRAAGIAWRAPFGRIAADGTVWASDHPDTTRTDAEYNYLSTGVFDALGLRMIAGRDFTDAEVFSGADKDTVAVISASLAKRLFGDAPAVGQLIERRYSEGARMLVVGVVADMRHSRIVDPVQPMLFTPLKRGYMQWGSILIGLDGSARDVIPGAQQAVAAIDPTLPLYSVETLDRSIARQLAESALMTRLTTTFAVLAVIVAALGLYGVLARGVADRRREFGIRAALGAGPASVARLVGGEAARVVLIGVAIGLATSWWLAKYLQDQLFEISKFDPISFAGAAALVAAVAALAALPPVRRAVRVDLAEMLRV